MENLQFFVANCLISGDKVTHREKAWIRNIIEFFCAGTTVVFTQKDWVLQNDRGDLAGLFCETSEVLISNISPCNLKSKLVLMDRLCRLLSFATMSNVLWYGYDYPVGSGKGYRRAVSGSANEFRPVFSMGDSTSIKSFIEQAYPAFARFEISRKLHVVIDYLVCADLPGQATELRLLMTFVVLENLKDTYARAQGIPYIAGAFRKGVDPNKRSGKYGFEELLHKMFREVGMRRGLKKIVRLRNEIVHSGISRLSHSSQWAIYERAQDLIREYVLRLLSYRGRLFNLRVCRLHFAYTLNRQMKAI